jgi:hypothetical protein
MRPWSSKPRIWRVVPRGTGWVLVLKNHGRPAFTVKPKDEVNGDSLDECRLQLATQGRYLDLYIEPDGSVFWVDRQLVMSAPEQLGEREMRIDGEIRLVMPEAEA